VNQQLPLTLHWPAHQRLENFVVGANAGALEAIRLAAEDPMPAILFLSGPNGSGKTHLLIAGCAAAGAVGRSAQYLDLARLSAPRDAMIRRFGGSELLAVDHVDAIAGDRDAEHALFDLYNRCRADGSSLLFAAREIPTALGLVLPDLISRLSIGTQWAVRPLDEASRRLTLRERAALRGIELDDAVLDWLFTRQARDLGTLTVLLERIDHAALAAQRRVTVPFLRNLLRDAD
jgi:DnaA family protein